MGGMMGGMAGGMQGFDFMAQPNPSAGDMFSSMSQGAFGMGSGMVNGVNAGFGM